MSKITTILIVDDDQDDQEMLREAIAEVAGPVRCLSAANGEEALRLLTIPEARLPDLIFLDMNMPRMGGLAFLQKRAQFTPLADIPVVIYSTSKRPEDEAETRRLGARDFITKPDSFEGIVRVVKGLLVGETKQM